MDSGTVLILVTLIAIPIAALVFALGAGNALRQIGKGDLAIDQDLPGKTVSATPPPVSKQVREAEIRQMLEARSYRRQRRGQSPIDVDAELAKILGEEEAGSRLGQDKELREEVRQLVVARNERRMRRGEEPLDVETEIERQLRELESLGQ